MFFDKGHYIQQKNEIPKIHQNFTQKSNQTD